MHFLNPTRRGNCRIAGAMMVAGIVAMTAGASAQTYWYSGPSVAIPDNDMTGVQTTLVVAGFSGTVSDLNFSFDGEGPYPLNPGLEHGFVGDLVVTLRSPAGTTVTIINRPGLGSNPGDDFHHMNLDDEATGSPLQSASEADAPFTGRWTPDNALSAFDGQNPNGTWTLTVSDRDALETGTLHAWSITLRNSAGNNMAPWVQFQSPASDTTVVNSVSTLAVTGRATDLDGTINSVQYSVNGGAFANATDTSGNWSTFSFNAPLSVGANTIDIRTNDNAGLFGATISRTITRAEPTEEGDGSFANPFVLRVEGDGFGAVTGLETTGGDDWLVVYPAADACSVTRVTLVRDPGPLEMYMQLFDPRCPNNGPGTFPRQIAGNFLDGEVKEVVYVDQRALNPIFVRVFPVTPDSIVPYELLAETLPADDDVEPNDVWPQAEVLAPAAMTTFTNLILRDDDWFVVDLADGETVTAVITFPSVSGDLNMQMFDVTGESGANFPANQVDNSYGFGNEESVSYTASGDRKVVVRVYGERLSTNLYDITIARTGGLAPAPSIIVKHDAGRIDNVTGDVYDLGDEQAWEMIAQAEAAAQARDESDGFEPNQNIDQANANATIDLGTPSVTAVCDDEDWYAIEQTQCGTLEIVLSWDEGAAPAGLGMQVLTEFCPPNGPGAFPQVIGANFSPVAGTNRVVTLDSSEEPVRYLRVFRLDPSGPTVPYTVTLNQLATDDDFEENDDPSNPVALDNPAVGSTTTLSQLVSRDEDYYAFDVIPGETFRVRVNFSTSSGDVNMQLFDADSVVPGTFPTSLVNSYGFGDQEEIVFTPDGSITRLMVRVYGERNSTNVYDMTYGWE